MTNGTLCAASRLRWLPCECRAKLRKNRRPRKFSYTIARSGAAVTVSLHEFAVAAARRLFAAVELAFVFFVFAVRALIEHYFAVAFERQDVGADAVEEPAVVTYDNGAAGEVVEAFFKGAERVDIYVVGGLVEQEHVAFFFESHGKVQAVAFAAREHGYFFLLIGAGEVEFRQVGAGVYVAAAHAECFNSLRNHFVDCAVGQEVVVTLVDVSDFYCFAHVECAGIGFFLSHDEAEKGGFAGAVGADYAYYAVGRQGEREVAEEMF